MHPLVRFLAGALVLLASYSALSTLIHGRSAGLLAQSRNWVQEASTRWDEVLALKHTQKRQQELLGSYNSERPPQNPHNGSKAVVVAATRSDDASWVARELPDWQGFVYHVDDTAAALHTPFNKGKEANAYLWHIITHYERLAEVTVFAHAHEGGYPRAWHVEDLDEDDAYSNPRVISRLQLPAVRRKGYLSLRCTAAPGCPADIKPFRAHGRSAVEEALPAAMFEMGLDLPGLGVPDLIAAPCCSQFAVSADMIRRRSKLEYVRVHQWLMDTELDDETSGRVLEYLWHILFGQMAVYCPDPLDCYCENFGMWCSEAEAQVTWSG